ncbi:unnamed protein product [Didymodactylos carnosus]|uniref:Uncharacterized protein n=1 Tax=Didymodactylos carnosus TaxID=1234261 RepID=A0A8S2NWX1_9BILA|nr:unnamed protein product [Didymodactylos carnosus]CAF4022287.1 unnamed protein product [Didymodactylos carnosus]
MATIQVYQGTQFQPTFEPIDVKIKQISTLYYQKYGDLLENMKKNFITKIQTSSIDTEETKQVAQKQIETTKRILKRKQECEEEVQHSRKFPATGISPPRLFRESPILNLIRQRTFSHWPLKQPSKTQITSAGFFSCNVGDRVICIYCNLICQQWISSDDPVETHKILSPNCCFVRSNLVSTVVTSPVIVNETSTIPANNEIVLARACNRQYVEIPKRYATYVTWPQNESLPAVDDLVKAGFFYSGTKTVVTCFYCSRSLQNWGEKDNPMIEHARWFPHCLYVKQLCGDDLYQKIQQSKRVHQS